MTFAFMYVIFCGLKGYIDDDAIFSIVVLLGMIVFDFVTVRNLSGIKQFQLAVCNYRRSRTQKCLPITSYMGQGAVEIRQNV